MKIAINALPYTSYQGIEVFFTSLLQHWPESDDKIIVFANKKSASFIQSTHNIEIIKYNIQNRLILFLFQQIYLYFLIRKHKIKILFCPSLEHPWLIKNKIVTIYDAAPFAVKGESGAIGRIFWKISVFFAKISSRAFITISEFSKKELMEKMKIKNKPIFIINVGTNKNIDSEQKKESEFLDHHQLEAKKYFLHVGNARKRKNLGILIKTFASIKHKYPEIKLVIAGKMDKDMDALKSSLSTEEKNIIFTGFISEKDKKILISRAAALIFPSLYEGFGIPILEAQILNTPVVCSDIPAFKEVAGNSALFFNPLSTEQLAEAMETIINNPELANNLRHQGAINCQRFNWRESAKKLSEIIHLYENPADK